MVSRTKINKTPTLCELWLQKRTPLRATVLINLFAEQGSLGLFRQEMLLFSCLGGAFVFVGDSGLNDRIIDLHVDSDSFFGVCDVTVPQQRRGQG